jgi:hypothetical protein
VTRKRSSAKPATRRPAAADIGPAASEARRAPNPDAPITGVASGSLGTAANLDDTQVMRTADLQRAAAEIAMPAWLTDDAPPLHDEPDAWASGSAVEPVSDQHDVPPRERVQPRESVQSRARAKAGPQPRGGVNVSRRTSALAGAAAGALLVLLAGAALLGNAGALTPNSGAGQGPLAESSFEPFATPSAEPTKDAKGCHGKGKDNGCKD